MPKNFTASFLSAIEGSTQWVQELVQIEIGFADADPNASPQIFRFVRNSNEDVVFDGKTWSAAQFDRSPLERSADLMDTRVNFEFDNVAGDFSRLIDPNRLEGAKVTIWLYDAESGLIAHTNYPAEAYFIGFFQTPEFEGGRMLVPATDFASRRTIDDLPKRTFQKMCNYTLYDADCNQDGTVEKFGGLVETAIGVGAGSVRLRIVNVGFRSGQTVRFDPEGTAQEDLTISTVDFTQLTTDLGVIILNFTGTTTQAHAVGEIVRLEPKTQFSGVGEAGSDSRIIEDSNRDETADYFDTGFVVLGDDTVTGADGLSGTVMGIEDFAIAAGKGLIKLSRDVGKSLVNREYRVHRGCEYTEAACKGKFDNFINYGGFLHVPKRSRTIAAPSPSGVGKK